MGSAFAIGVVCATTGKAQVMKTTKRLFLWGATCLFVLAFGCSNETGGAITASDGVEIRFDRVGDGSPTLIFVHGWANDRSIWDAQVAHFSTKYEVVNVDLPSFGDSGSDRERYTMASFGEDIATVIRKLDIDEAVLVGFSMGAPVVIEAANKVPERVAGVVLVDQLQDIEAKTSPEEISATAEFFLGVAANPTNEALVSGGFYMKETDAAFEKIAAMLEGAPRAGWEDSLLEGLLWLSEHCTEAVSRVEASIISINSDRVPTNVEAFRKYAPSFQARIIPDTGHVVMWDAPDEFNRLLEESIQELTGP